MMNTQTESEAKEQTPSAQRGKDTPSPASLGPWLIVLAGAMMCWISWLKWPDLLVDYGEQIYVPWRLSEGDVLFKDIFYFYGPASAYLHSWVLTLFGPGILKLAIFNILIISGLSFQIYILFKRISDAWTALFCSLIFVLVFAFAQYRGGGIFNFVCPYSYELTHGVVLSFVTLYQFLKFTENPSAKRLAAVGGLAGLVYLTKPEVFLALSLALTVGLAAFQWTSRSTPSKIRKDWLVFSGAFVSLPLLFVLYFSIFMSPQQAVEAILYPWILILKFSLGDSPLYQWIMGADNAGSNILISLGYLLVYIFAVSTLAVTSRWSSGFSAKPLLVSTFISAIVLGLTWTYLAEIPWFELLRPLPWFMLLLALWHGMHFFKPENAKDNARNVFLFTFAVFAFILLLKIIFKVRVFHYGFALALPATLLLIKLLLHDVPKIIGPFLGNPLHYRKPVTILIIFYIGFHVWIQTNIYQYKTYPVGSGYDRIVDFDPSIKPRAPVVSQALDYIRAEIGTGEGLPVLPDGIMLNYLTRHKNPVKLITFNPLHSSLIGEDTFLGYLKDAQPSYIVLVERDMSLIGARYFGQDYAQESFRWIQRNYFVQKQFGEVPFSGRGFGIQILRRKDIRN